MLCAWFMLCCLLMMIIISVIDHLIYMLLLLILCPGTARLWTRQIFKNAAKGRGWGTGWGRWWGAWGYYVWRLWGELCFRWILDLLRHMWEVVSWKMREDNSCQSWAHQALQVPCMQQQENAALILQEGGLVVIKSGWIDRANYLVLSSCEQWWNNFQLSTCSWLSFSLAIYQCLIICRFWTWVFYMIVNQLSVFQPVSCTSSDKCLGH